MSLMVKRIMGSKAGKAGVVAMLSAAALGLAAPSSNASNEASWTDGCRGYWYTTSGHAYCQGSTRPYLAGQPYNINYDCNYELDEYQAKSVKTGTVGKISTYECTFKINGTRVY